MVQVQYKKPLDCIQINPNVSEVVRSGHTFTIKMLGQTQMSKVKKSLKSRKDRI